MLVKRRPGVLGELVTEFGLKLNMAIVPSEGNAINVLTKSGKGLVKGVGRIEAKCNCG